MFWALIFHCLRDIRTWRRADLKSLLVLVSGSCCFSLIPLKRLHGDAQHAKALLWASDLHIFSVTPGFLGAVFLEDILAQLIFASDILTQFWKSCTQDFERSKNKKKQCLMKSILQVS
jgi:hypothetical protein